MFMHKKLKLTTTANRVIVTKFSHNRPSVRNPPPHVSRYATRNQLKDDHICSQPQETDRAKMLDYIAGDMAFCDEREGQNVHYEFDLHHSNDWYNRWTHWQ